MATMSALEQAIYKTIAFFDLFTYPLTNIEVRRWLCGYQQPTTLLECVTALDRLVAQKIIVCRDGCYALPGSQQYVDDRHMRYGYAHRKYTRALRAAAVLRYWPPVLAIAVCNSLAYNNARQGSDIDVVIIARAGQLWLARLGAIVLTSLLGIRLHTAHKQDKICLSFYVAHNGLDLQSVALPNDPYLAYWLATLTPIYNHDIIRTFQQANEWIQKYLPSTWYTDAPRRLVAPTGISTVLHKIWNGLEHRVVPALEQLARRVQWRRLLPALREAAKQPEQTGVVISPQMLKFHLRDMRQEFLTEWQKRVDRGIL